MDVIRTLFSPVVVVGSGVVVDVAVVEVVVVDVVVTKNQTCLRICEINILHLYAKVIFGSICPVGFSVQAGVTTALGSWQPSAAHSQVVPVPPLLPA